MTVATGKKLKAPYPYFGGKSAIADLVWDHVGNDITNWIEPFAGSLAVTLARPTPFNGVETVNDVNGYVTNFWRATSRNPEAVASHCNYPVSELDLHARHRWLVISPEAQEFAERMRRDPDHYDAKIAGWWVWGACCWIGSGWCDNGVDWQQTPDLTSGGCGDAAPSGSESLAMPRPKTRHGQPDLPGVLNPKGGEEWKARPAINKVAGNGVNVSGALQRPVMDAGRGGHPAPTTVQRKRPRAASERQSTDTGMPGVLGRPQLADAYDVGRGAHSTGDIGTHEARYLWLLDWFRRLQDRLRLVRVCCGHWLRVCESDSVTTRLGTTGIFLDPPYPTHRADTGEESRNSTLYVGDDKDALDKLRDEILAYCLERGERKEYRISLACYEGDGYEPLEAKGWECVAWRSQGGYGNRSAKGKANRGRERIYFSPHCRREATLFDTLEF